MLIMTSIAKNIVDRDFLVGWMMLVVFQLLWKLNLDMILRVILWSRTVWKYLLFITILVMMWLALNRISSLIKMEWMISLSKCGLKLFNSSKKYQTLLVMIFSTNLLEVIFGKILLPFLDQTNKITDYFFLFIERSVLK